MTKSVTVSGQTFQHRDMFKQLGGQWDGDAKNWRFSWINATDLAKLKNLPGCMVTEDLPPAPRKTIEQDAEDLDAFWLKITERQSNDRPATGIGSSIMYGDDQRWHNHFKDKNPIAFFGFSSLKKMVDFIKAIPEDKRSGERNAGWKKGGEWHGTRDMDAAFDLALNGWKAGAENAAKVLEFLNVDNAIQRRRKFSVAGGSVSVGRMLAGNPSHMVQRPKQPGRKVMTLFVENVASSYINAESLVVRAAIVAALADIVETHGYSCEIVSLSVVKRHDDRPAAHTAVTLKHAGEKLNVDDLAFALGHPSFLRRFTFACVSQCDALRNIWETQGQVTQAFNSHHPPGRNEFYIKGLKKNFDAGSLEATALEMLPFVKPENLPIEVKST